MAAHAEPGLARLVLLARDLLGAVAACVSLVDAANERLHASVGLPDGYGAGAAIPLDLSLCVGIVETGEPVVVADLASHGVLQHHPLLRDLGLRSYAGVPLRNGDHVLGGLCALGDATRPWDEADLRLLRELAEPVARELHLRGVVEHLRRSRDLEHRLAAEQSVLRRVATAVARGRDPEQVLRVAAEEVAGLLRTDSVAVVRFLPSGAVEVVAQGGPSPHEEGVCSAVLAELRSTVAPASDVESSPPCLAAPVVVAGRLWGALVAAGRPAPGDGQAHLAHLAQLADLVGVCVSNTEAHERLVQQSRTDPLTGAANRRAFGERMAEELLRAARAGTCITLALLDLDRFKALNDRHGHALGDRVLCEFVGRVESELRAGDVLARLGGDEFAVVLPETDSAAASSVLERVVHAVASVPLAGIWMTCTVGAAVMEAGEANAETLYSVADGALYRGKDRGRGSLVVERLR